ncbi:MAG: cupin domain-containing protein [Candidatus Eiseniibacteriota bacterium]|jgi:uncharacterized cupin superfamily protein
MDEAKVVRTEAGLVPEGAGWFVVNAAEAPWYASERFGRVCAFQGEHRCPGLGVNIHVVEPGQAACMYHAETEPEAFLVLHGECLLVIEEEERPLHAWDYVHCPPGVRHVFVGAGEGPCAILMIGRRSAEHGVDYPVSEVAGKHGASVPVRTPEPRTAYAGSPPWVAAPVVWPL